MAEGFCRAALCAGGMDGSHKGGQVLQDLPPFSVVKG